MICRDASVTNLNPRITSVLKCINVDRLVGSHLKTHENYQPAPRASRNWQLPKTIYSTGRVTTDPLYSRPWTQRVGLVSRRVPIFFFPRHSAMRERDGFTGGAVRSLHQDEAANFSHDRRVSSPRDEARSIRFPPVEFTRTTGVKSRWRRPTSGRQSDRSNLRERDFQIRSEIVSINRRDERVRIFSTILVSREGTANVPLTQTRVVVSSAPSIGIITDEIKGGSATHLISWLFVARPRRDWPDNIATIFPNRSARRSHVSQRERSRASNAGLTRRVPRKLPSATDRLRKQSLRNNNRRAVSKRYCDLSWFCVAN